MNRNVMNHSPKDTVSHPKTLESKIYYDYSEVETEIFKWNWDDFRA